MRSQLGGTWARVLVALAMLGAAAPSAGADELPACEEVTDEDALVLGEVYVREHEESLELWEEANGARGLQTEACQTPGQEPLQPDVLEQAVDVPQVPQIPNCFDFGMYVICIS